MSNNDFEDVQKADVKRSLGFYIFMALWVIVSGLWLANGGAADGAWWVFGIGVAILVVNAVANMLSRKKA